MKQRTILLALALVSLAGAAFVGGCARGEPTGATTPQAVMDIMVQFAGPVDDSAYYFVAIEHVERFCEVA